METTKVIVVYIKDKDTKVVDNICRELMLSIDSISDNTGVIKYIHGATNDTANICNFINTAYKENDFDFIIYNAVDPNLNIDVNTSDMFILTSDDSTEINKLLEDIFKK